MTTTPSSYPPPVPHEVVFEAPDTIRITLVGKLEPAQVKSIGAEIRELTRKHGPLYWLFDVSQFGSTGERVRELFINAGKDQVPIQAGVMWGASFSLRVATMMVLTAGARINRESYLFDFDFTNTEDEARAWIASKRPAPKSAPSVGEFMSAAI